MNQKKETVQFLIHEISPELQFTWIVAHFNCMFPVISTDTVYSIDREPTDLTHGLGRDRKGSLFNNDFLHLESLKG